MQIVEEKGFFTPDEISKIPEGPGVYLFKNKRGEIIYIGKAVNLRKRVSSYFHRKNSDPKTEALIKNISLIDTISLNNESEALLLEANLIKQYQPKYNIDFKDNKFYPYIKITINDDFPRIVYSRDQKSDGSLYFGPFVSARATRASIDIIQQVFLLRTCKKLPKKECLNYHIKRCSAPCIGKISKEDYDDNVKQAIEFLKGKYTELLSKLETEMKQASKMLEFEKAQAIKEKIEAIKHFEESQNVILDESINRDYVGVFSKWGKIVIVVSMVRNGKMIGKKSYSGNLHLDEDAEEVLPLFLLNYANTLDIKPDFFVIDRSFASILEALNSVFENYKIKVILPENEREESIIKLTTENASIHFTQLWSKVDSSENLKNLQEILGLKKFPARIEGFDVANIMGEYAVASIVSFFNGKPDKSNYRHMKIRTKSTPDDYAMIYEAVYRRYSRLKRENKEFPDLVLIDGGKGQLNAALKAISDAEVNIDVIALAKQNEEIYLPSSDTPLVLPKNSAILHLLQQVRDETHRFANTFFRKIKGKQDIKSIFDDIKGIGEKRKKIIMQKFLDYDIIKNIKKEDLTSAGLPVEVAEKVYSKLKEIINREGKK